ncbi:MAG TPA: MBL fold metallo-hydrolase, partial [Blastocatellia bacterium]|nr:MBL fold metallo-hydrolase [Blastocatellia bacterium]
MRITFLGTGTSVGVPMIGCECEVCRSNDPRDKRLRTGLMVEMMVGGDPRRLVIDVSA